MVEVIKLGSGVPRVPLRRADDLIERITVLKDDATARGFGTLAYFLEMALTEAGIQARQIEADRANAKVKPEELWRPEEGSAG